MRGRQSRVRRRRWRADREAGFCSALAQNHAEGREPTTQRAMQRTRRCVGLTALALLVAAIGVWGALLLEYAGPRSELLRTALVVGFALAAVATLIALFVRHWHWPAIGAYVVLWAGLAVLWSSREPTNDRDWQTDLAVLAHATIDGDVTVHNIRSFDYRSETAYMHAYYDKTFDLGELRSLDIVTSYWTGPAIAHVFVSFGFAVDDYLTISVEVRKPKGEGYSTLKGFFGQYELVYIVATSETSSGCALTSPRSAGGRVRLSDPGFDRGQVAVVPGVHAQDQRAPYATRVATGQTGSRGQSRSVQRRLRRL